MPKTATHAIRAALASHLSDDDWQQQALFGNQRIPIPALAAIGHGHIALQQVRTRLPEEIWDSYFKFAFVRNPYDRYVSVCAFLNRQNPNYEAQSVNFMKNAIQAERFQQRILVRPQYKMLTEADGTLGMDFIGRYETLQESYDIICDKLGIQTQLLSQKNNSEHASFMQYYDDELIHLVTEFYRLDLDLFGYDIASDLGKMPCA